MTEIEITDGQSVDSLLKEVLRDTCMSTTTHGVPKILKTNSHTILKIIWILCLITCVTAGSVSIYKSIEQYLSYPSFISTSIVEEIPTEFPAVTICNMKSVNSSTIDGDIVTKSAAINNNFSSLFEWLETEHYTLRLYVNNNPKYTEERRKAMGFKIEDMLVSCYFNYLPCYATDFTYFYNPLYGNCYTFNAAYDNNGRSKKSRTSTLSGYYNGLILEFFVGKPSANTLIEYRDGLIVSIQNQTDEPFWQGDTLKASAGSENDFIVKRNFVTKLPAPHGNCISDPSVSPYYKFITGILNNSYSEELCFQLCIQDQIIKTCGCADIFLPKTNDNSTLFCNSFSSINCMKRYINNFSMSDGLRTCKAACPFECFSIEYEVSSHKALYPTLSYIDTLFSYSQNQNLNLNYSEVSQAFAKVNVYTQIFKCYKTEFFAINISNYIVTYSLLCVNEINFSYESK